MNFKNIELKKINYVINTKIKYLLLALVVSTSFISLLELFGIGMLAGLVLFLADIEKFVSTLPDFRFLDVFKNSSKNELINIFLILVILFFIIKNILIFIFTYCFNKLRLIINFSVTKKLLSKYLNSDYSFILNQNNSQLIHNVKEESNRFTGIFFQIVNIIKEIFLILFLFISIIAINWKVTLIVSIFLICISFIIFSLIKKKLFDLGKKQTIFQTKVLKSLYETFSDIKFIKIKSIENFFFNKIMSAQKNLLKVGLFTSTIVVIPRLILEILAVAGLCITIYFLLEINKPFNEIIPFLTFLSLSIIRMVPAIASLNNGINSVITQFISIDIVTRHITKEDQNISEPFKSDIDKKSDIKSLELKGVYFKYFLQNDYVLNNINLKLEKNDILGVIGESGSGKTTLGDILTGVLKPENGNLLINEKIISNNSDLLNYNISYVPQTVTIIDENLDNNIAYGVEESIVKKDQITKLLKMASLDDINGNFNSKMMGESGSNISGGQKQRIGLARAFYGNPDLVVLDEPTSELDFKTEKNVINNLKNYSENKILVLIAHRLNTLEICNKLLILKNGKIFDFGIKDEIVKKHDYINQYFKIEKNK